MATRRRLRAVLNLRRASQPCWRCALSPSRSTSTSHAGIQGSSKCTNEGSPYHEVPGQKYSDTSRTIRPTIQTSSAQFAGGDVQGTNTPPDFGISGPIESKITVKVLRKIPTRPRKRRAMKGQSTTTPCIPMRVNAPCHSSEEPKSEPAKVVLKPSKRPQRVNDDFAHWGNDNFASLIRKHGSDGLSPPATENPPAVTAPAVRKVFFQIKHDHLHDSLASFITTHRYGSGHETLASFISTHPYGSRNEDAAGKAPTRPHLLPPQQSESMEVSRKPRIRVAMHGQPVALLTRSQSRSTQVVHTPPVPEETPPIPEETPPVSEEAIPRRVISMRMSPRELAQEELIPRKDFPSLIGKFGIDMGEYSGNEIRVPSGDRREDETFYDEVVPLLDELQDLMSDKPNVATETEVPVSRSQPWPQHLSLPSALGSNRTSNSQNLGNSKALFSTWSSRAAHRCYATAAVSHDSNVFGIFPHIKAFHRVRL